MVLFSIESRLAADAVGDDPGGVLHRDLAYRKLARAVTREGMRAMADVNAAIKETVSGIAVAKNFRQESSIYEEFDKANLTSYRVNVRRGLVLSFLWPSLNIDRRADDGAAGVYGRV